MKLSEITKNINEESDEEFDARTAQERKMEGKITGYLRRIGIRTKFIHYDIDEETKEVEVQVSIDDFEIDLETLNKIQQAFDVKNLSIVAMNNDDIYLQLRWETTEQQLNEIGKFGRIAGDENKGTR